MPGGMRRVLGILALILVALAAVVAVRTARYRLEPVRVVPVEPIPVNATEVADRLARAIQFPTISHEDPSATEWEIFDDFGGFLAETYPELHRALDLERVGRAGLLYSWQGRERALAPLVLMAHFDVVPVQPGTEVGWTHPPFAGVVADGFVWGRGTLDDKGSLIALCEAVEGLVRAGWTPRRTLLLAFGHDEEVGGGDGAARVARLLAGRELAPEFVVDEGGGIAMPGVVAGVDRQVALIGIAEKGYLTLELTVAGGGGHSSQPPPQTSVGILAAAVAALERHQMPLALRGAAREMMLAVGPVQPLLMRAALANLWLTEPFFVRGIAGSPQINALLRTTTAATMFEGSPKENVLAGRARAVVNFRLLPGDTVQEVVEHARRAIDDERVTVEPLGGFASEPSPVADTSSWGFRELRRTVLEIFPDALPAPNLVVGGTDSRYFGELTRNVYRFAPFPVSVDDFTRFHGTDERVGVADLGRAVGFYDRLIRTAAGVEPAAAAAGGPVD